MTDGEVTQALRDLFHANKVTPLRAAMAMDRLCDEIIDGMTPEEIAIYEEHLTEIACQKLAPTTKQ